MSRHATRNDTGTPNHRLLFAVVFVGAFLIVMLYLYAYGGGSVKVSTPAAMSACVGDQCPTALRTISVVTDRPTYRSRESGWINITIESDRDSEAKFNVHGINAGYERLNFQTTQTLGKGKNILAVPYSNPSCTGCAGIKPANYSITVEVTADGLTKTAETTVEILQ